MKCYDHLLYCTKLWRQGQETGLACVLYDELVDSVHDKTRTTSAFKIHIPNALCVKTALTQVAGLIAQFQYTIYMCNLHASGSFIRCTRSPKTGHIIQRMGFK